MKIKEIIFDEDKKSLRPIIVNFSNGKLLQDSASQLSCGVYSNDKEIMPIIASQSMIYTGKVQKKDDLYNHFIAIRNRKTNKMRLVSVDQVMLKPEPPKSREIIDSTMLEVNKTALSELNKQFGSKRTKRQTEQMEKLKINVEHVKDQLEKTVMNVAIDETNDAEQESADYIPLLNENANSVDEIYKASKLVPKEILKSLESVVVSLISEESSLNELNEFAQQTFKRVVEMKTSEQDKVKKLSCVLILDSLLNVHFSKAKDIVSKSYEASKYSKSLSQFIIETFTIKTDRSRARPLSMKDKTVLYFIVFAALLSNYTVNLNEISEALKVSKKKLQDFCRILRFSIKGSFGELKLPLPAPVRRTPKKSKK